MVFYIFCIALLCISHVTLLSLRLLCLGSSYKTASNVMVIMPFSSIEQTFSLFCSFNIGSADDELMLNVLRCHLTY